MKNEKVSLIIIITIMLACLLGIIAICYNYFKDEIINNEEIKYTENVDIKEEINIDINVENENYQATSGEKIDESKEWVYPI